MLGALIGDIVGSRFEWTENKKKNFVFLTHTSHFTDDTLMTLAIAEAFVLGKTEWKSSDFQKLVIRRMVRMGRKYPNATWGAMFYKWLFESPRPYQSYGNGAAMRVSSVGWIAESEEDVRYFSKLVTEVSHNHPEGLKGAEAVAMAIYLCRIGTDRQTVRQRMISYYPAMESMKLSAIRPTYGIDQWGNFMTCQGSVPPAIVAFLESTDFEDAIRNAVSLGGDTDTQAAIAGSIAEAFYGVSPELEEKALSYLDDDLRSIYYAFETVRLARHPQ